MSCSMFFQKIRVLTVSSYPIVSARATDSCFVSEWRQFSTPVRLPIPRAIFEFCRVLLKPSPQVGQFRLPAVLNSAPH